MKKCNKYHANYNLKQKVKAADWKIKIHGKSFYR